jgi:hypothetical protein
MFLLNNFTLGETRTVWIKKHNVND